MFYEVNWAVWMEVRKRVGKATRGTRSKNTAGQEGQGSLYTFPNQKTCFSEPTSGTLLELFHFYAAALQPITKLVFNSLFL